MISDDFLDDLEGRFEAAKATVARLTDKASETTLSANEYEEFATAMLEVRQLAEKAKAVFEGESPKTIH